MIFHFLCEGEKGKSEYQFIQRIIDEFRTSEQYTLTAVGGNEGISQAFLELSNQFKAGDIFILFFDHVETIAGRTVPVILQEIREICKNKSVHFRYTTYYCFEELFLSYEGLDDLIVPKLHKCIIELVKIREDIRSGKKDYRMRFDYKFWIDLFPNLASAKTREQLSARLLVELLLSTNGRFRVNKSSVGECWLYSCSILEKDKVINYRICEKCTYCCKGCAFRDKLADLDSRSVSSLSEPFSSIFNI